MKGKCKKGMLNLHHRLGDTNLNLVVKAATQQNILQEYTKLTLK